MNIKIENTGAAIEDAKVIISSANSFESLVSTMRTVKQNFESNWSGDSTTDRDSIISGLENSIKYYNNYIIPALSKLGAAIDAYALATEQLAAASVGNSAITAGMTPSEYSNSLTPKGVESGRERTVDLPLNRDTSTTTYMNWNQKWNADSNQKFFKQQAELDNNVTVDNDGFYLVNDGKDDRYVVAMTTKYGDVGDYIDVYQEDGTVLKCVIGDAKSYNDANSGEYGHMYSGTINVLEFMTNWSDGHSNPGSVRTSLDKNITRVINTGYGYEFTNDYYN